MLDFKEKTVGVYIDRTIKVIRQYCTRLFKELNVDLTAEQWVLLTWLCKNEGVTQNELANSSFKNAPTVSRIMDLLCKKGYTMRKVSKKDKRKQLIYVTDLGKEIHERVYPHIQEMREKGWNHLSDEDYENFIRIVNQVYFNYKD